MNTKILELANKNLPQMIKFLIDMISIPSTSCHEKSVAMRIKNEMEMCGFDEVRIDGLGSVVGRIGKGDKKIAFDAHIDTVDVGNKSLWTFDPFNGFEKDGKVFGRGAADQKAGMASMVYAGKIIKELGLADDCTLFFTGTVMEEDCDGLCWQYLIKEENLRPDLCVITEPTGLGIYRGHRGRMELELEVPGLSSHGSAPQRGDNAIYKMSRVILEIEKLNERLRRDEFLGKGTVVVSQINGSGPSQCAVADICKIYLDRRLTWGETKDKAVSEIQAIVDHFGIKGAKTVVPKYVERSYTGKVYPTEKYYPTWKLEANHPAVKASINTYRQLFAKEPVVNKWTFSTNAVAICGMHNIPCIGFGPGFEEQAHAPDEFCPVDHLASACAFYAAFPEFVL